MTHATHQAAPNTTSQAPPDSSSAPAAAPASMFESVRLAAGDIKLSHSVFALPFAVLGAFLARAEGSSWGRFAGQAALVVGCMVLARTWAMLVNRLADARFDAANPRTVRRAIASGRLSSGRGWALALACAAGFVGLCAAFWVFFDNPWPTYLCVPVLAWLALYSYAKRFTMLCHVLLGSALAISPPSAALAVEPSALASSPALWLLAGMVLCWVAGFDVIYALQDVEFDRRAGLHSLPSRLGVGDAGPRRAIWLVRGLHALALAFLVAAWRSEPRLGLIFGAAVALAGVLLVMEHVVLARRGLAGLPMAFFTLNGIISVTLGLAGIIDLTIA
jgi:4-hydroxybenzoate polyprenyltransferase